MSLVIRYLKKSGDYPHQIGFKSTAEIAGAWHRLFP